jgi:hypothetical protein
MLDELFGESLRFSAWRVRGKVRFNARFNVGFSKYSRFGC